MSWLKNHARLLAGLIALSCGVDQVKPAGQTGDDGASGLPDTLSMTVGPRGGELRVLGVTMVVPEGALTADTLLTLATLGEEATLELASLGSDVHYLGSPVAFLPHGQRFLTPVHIKMTPAGSASSRVVRRLDDPMDLTWEEIASDQSGDSSDFDTEHFSVYALTSAGVVDSGGSPGVGGQLGVGGRLSSGSGGLSAAGGAKASSSGGQVAAAGAFGGEAGAFGFAGSAGGP